MNITIINGPNLNLIGRRETSIYGMQRLDDYWEELKRRYPEINFTFYQSNIEGEIINFLHKVGFESDGIVLNAGAYTHTSIAIADAIRAINTPVIEVHISNTSARESFRQKSHLSPYCKGTITGFGLDSYRLAIEAFV